MRARLALALVAVSTVARASVPEMFGMGARLAALGATGAADADGFDAAYANPAGLVEADRRRLTLGYVGARSSLTLDGKSHDALGDTDGVVLGAVLPLPLGGPLADLIALGLAFHLPAGVINRADAPYPDVPRLALLDARTQVVTVSASVGLRVTRWLSVGAGAVALAALVGEIRITPDASGHIGTVAEEQLVTSYSPVVGARAHLHNCTLGVAVRGASQSDYDIAVTNKLGNALPLEIPTLHITGVAQYDPLEAAAEAAVRLSPSWLLVGGVTYKEWSSYPSPSARVTVSAPDPIAPRFHDTAVPRLAVEWTRELGRLAVAARGGWFYEWSPAPPGMASQSVLVDADRNVVTAGAGLSWKRTALDGALDAFVQWHELVGSARASGGFVVFGASVGVDL